MIKMRDYKNIKAFQLADNLAVEVYKVTKKFPREEPYGLVSQLRRAAVSVPANIAEGASRQHLKDYANFLYIARGSLVETEYLLCLSNKLGYLDNVSFGAIDDLRKNAARTLFGLIEAIKNQIS